LQGARAIELLNQLNKMNFSSVSLVRRVLGLPEVVAALPPGDVSGSQDLPTPTPTVTP